MDPPSVQSSPAASATSLKAQLQHWARELRARMTARGAQAKLAADEVALVVSV